MSALLINNYSTRNTFIWGNRYNSITDTYTDSGSGSTLLIGMLIGRVTETGKVKQSVSTATDGSQIPIGICATNYTFTAAETGAIEICIQGDVDYGMLVFGGSPADTIATVIKLNDGTTALGTVGDILNGKGILPINTNEMTYIDNQ